MYGIRMNRTVSNLFKVVSESIRLYGRIVGEDTVVAMKTDSCLKILASITRIKREQVRGRDEPY